MAANEGCPQAFLSASVLFPLPGAAVFPSVMGLWAEFMN